jgi:hypothetical protein
MTLVLDNPLAEYLTSVEHHNHAQYAYLVFKYHKMKCSAIDNRDAGILDDALRADKECDHLAALIERYEKKSNEEAE